MTFEEFKSKGGKFLPQVTINKAGGFGISSGMHRRYDIDRYTGVKLYFDKDRNWIGIKMITEELDGMFTLKKRPNQKGAFFAAKSFLQAYSINPKEYFGRYEPVEVNEPNVGDLFVIDLGAKNKKTP
ncbi:MAG: hypothetical protein AAB667_00925 [Patescibacteria group bacterium]